MPSYEHNKLRERISQLNQLPESAAEYANWIKADGHLTLLKDNAQEDELVIYGVGEFTFVHAVIVNENSLFPLDKDDLLNWNDVPHSPCASYASAKGGNGFSIERTDHHRGSETLKGAQQLVFARHFDGLNGRDANYFEVLQEYSHLTETHWRSEQHAYCRFDENGDFDHIVSITSQDDDGALVTFRREPLELYLAASNSVLIRLFDFTLLRLGEFAEWPDSPDDEFTGSDTFFYRQKIDAGKAAYTRGVQIIRPSRPKAEIFASFRASWSGKRDARCVEFIALDWRNNRITEISTDPTATTSYFEAHKNNLPHQISPAFFRPDVLLKYKIDRDKYTIEERFRTIRCRGAWSLRRYDVNEAGQVHAYIKDLRNLPYEEQQYWASFNEKPKAGISNRALENDIKGEWVFIVDPLEDIRSVVERWADLDLTWWHLREESLLGRANTPRTSSRDEWAQAFMDLSKLIIEGFQVKIIRGELTKMQIAFNKEERSLALLEKLLIGHNKITNSQRLDGLRTVQNIRNKVIAHSGSSEAGELANTALRDHETFPAHFESVCRTVTNELKLIEQTFAKTTRPQHQ